MGQIKSVLLSAASFLGDLCGCTLAQLFLSERARLLEIFLFQLAKRTSLNVYIHASMYCSFAQAVHQVVEINVTL
jgi:hypothetical protein